MRNGNPPRASHRVVPTLGSYPTYEEWKPTKTPKAPRLDFSVLILPMRNGNFLYLNNLLTIKNVLILPMRNGNFCHYPVLASPINPVLILPMRNGNDENEVTVILELLEVLILPMRNGNNPNFSLNSGKRLSSYPTYEEWKRYRRQRTL